MARYIDADLLMSDAEHKGRYDVVNAFDIANTPTADVRENVHGNWVGIDDEPCETFECDRCGFVLEDWILGAFYNFCPNCGADMRKEGDKA